MSASRESAGAARDDRASDSGGACLWRYRRETNLMRSRTSRTWSGPGSADPDPLMRTLPFVLSLTAGSTDIIGFLGLNGLFTAHITGNIVVLAAHMVAGDPAIFSYMLSVPVFMLVLLLTRVLACGLERSGLSTLQPLLLLQLVFLAAFFGLGVMAGPWRNADALLAIIAGMFGVAGMAVQNAVVQIALKNTPSTAVMTTNVTHFMLDLGVVLRRRCDQGRHGTPQRYAHPAGDRRVHNRLRDRRLVRSRRGAVLAGFAYVPRPARFRHVSDARSLGFSKYDWLASCHVGNGG